jgi:hypothetical protein
VYLELVVRSTSWPFVLFLTIETTRLLVSRGNYLIS